MNPGSYKTGYVGHVHHKVSTNVLADPLKKAEVNAPRIGARTGNNEFGTVFSRQSLDLIQVNSFSLSVHPIRNYIVQPA
jgi:hypothetical protein